MRRGRKLRSKNVLACSAASDRQQPLDGRRASRRSASGASPPSAGWSEVKGGSSSGKWQKPRHGHRLPTHRARSSRWVRAQYQRTSAAPVPVSTWRLARVSEPRTGFLDAPRHDRWRRVTARQARRIQTHIAKSDTWASSKYLRRVECLATKDLSHLARI